VTFSAVRVEGALIPGDILQRIAAGEIEGQRSPADFGVPKGVRLTDVIASVWSDARAYWEALQRAVRHLPEDDPATTATRNQWIQPLLEALDFRPHYFPKAEVHGGLTFAVSHRAEADPESPPIHVEGLRTDLDRRGRLRVSPHSLVQDYLNRTERLWGVVTNGRQLRLLRKSGRMTRPAYVEFDLEQIMQSESFPGFALLYRLLHRTRLPKTTAEAEHCLLEKYHQLGIESGGRVRERLRDGVEQALRIFGDGFLQHPANEPLRSAFASGKLKPEDYYRQLLRLIYRLLFLMTAEERKLAGPSDARPAAIYSRYYSLNRLRTLAGRRHLPGAARHTDLWQGLCVTFQLYCEDRHGPKLSLAPLNGDLFGPYAMRDLENTELSNQRLLDALRHLSLFEDHGVTRRINYAALDVEELGSVYESLLDFHPVVENNRFDLLPGSERKTTGSYYTRPELVHELIKSALDPVIGSKPQTQEGLLSLTVCDPACGSGHFLLAAARRIGRRLAQIRSGEDEPAPEVFRIAVRDVVRHSIYGVDLNPLAVDLCKLALWLESHAAGKPLTFLDHRIRCGNSLIGATPETFLKGVPDDAFKPVAGDGKEVAKQLKKRNRLESGASLWLDKTEFRRRQLDYARHALDLAAVRDDTAQAVHQKERQYEGFRHEAERMRDETAANLWTAAFVAPLTDAALVPTQGDLVECLQQHTRLHGRKTGLIAQLATQHRFFHWRLEFPEVFEQGGFDCVLGNPPWERIKLQEQEFFAPRAPKIAEAPNKAARQRLINKLPETNPELAAQFAAAKHAAEAAAKFVRFSGRFPLTAVGDVNTYALFAELAHRLLGPTGRAGIIVPDVIATNATTAPFFEDLVISRSLQSLYGFKNERFLFAGIEHTVTFALMTMGGKDVHFDQMEFCWLAWTVDEMSDPARRVVVSPEDITLLNPNTRTCPVFRTRADAELTKKIYRRVPVLVNEATGENPWGVSFLRMFDMANDSGLFRTREELEGEGWRLEGNRFVRGGEVCLPLYEAKMIHQYDHRWATYDGGRIRDVTPEEKSRPNFAVMPRYWVPEEEVVLRISRAPADLRQACRARDPQAIQDAAKAWLRQESLNAGSAGRPGASLKEAELSILRRLAGELPEDLDDFFEHAWMLINSRAPKWLLGFRDVARNTDERTAIFGVMPRVGVGHKAPLVITRNPSSALLLGNLNSLVTDYLVRQKMGGTSLSYFVLKQIPVFQPTDYRPHDRSFILPRVLELTHTSCESKAFAEEIHAQAGSKSVKCSGQPSPFDEARRARLRAELDAYYAKLYGLTRDELRYILDPQDVCGPDFPGETFRVLKEREIREYGEYRTRRLVLEAWDALEAGRLK